MLLPSTSRYTGMPATLRAQAAHHPHLEIGSLENTGVAHAEAQVFSLADSSAGGSGGRFVWHVHKWQPTKQGQPADLGEEANPEDAESAKPKRLQTPLEAPRRRFPITPASALSGVAPTDIRVVPFRTRACAPHQKRRQQTASKRENQKQGTSKKHSQAQSAQCSRLSHTYWRNSSLDCHQVMTCSVHKFHPQARPLSSPCYKILNEPLELPPPLADILTYCAVLTRAPTHTHEKLCVVDFRATLIAPRK